MRATSPLSPLTLAAAALAPLRILVVAPLRILVVGAGFELALGLLAWMLGFLLGIDPFAHWYWTRDGLAWGGVAILPMLAMAGAAFQAPGKAWQELRDFLDDVVAPLFLRCRAWHLLLLSLAAGWGEELLFRGLLQRGLAAVVIAWGVAPNVASVLAVLVAALAFGVAHPLTRLYVVGATVLGGYLGLCFELSGNLLVPVIAHAGYDFLVLIFLVRRARARESRRHAADVGRDRLTHSGGGQNSSGQGAAVTGSASGDST